MPKPTRPCARCDGQRHWTGSRWRCADCHTKHQQERRASLSAERREAELIRSRELATVRRNKRTPEQRARDIAIVQAWRDANPERHKSGARDWYSRNAEYARSAKLAEYYANPEEFYARNLLRKARIAELVCEHGPKCVTAEVIKALYGQACLSRRFALCGESGARVPALQFP